MTTMDRGVEVEVEGMDTDTKEELSKRAKV
jgi:hypothetical protein